MTLLVGYKPAFIRSYKKLPVDLQEEVKVRVALFCEQPEHPSLRVHRLKGPMKGQWSFSVNYAYRIVFIYTQKTSVVLLAVGNHDVYR